MLVISRRKGQRITIGDEIELVVTELHRSSVKLGISAPRGYSVLRGEIHDSIETANRDALENLDGVLELDIHLGSIAEGPPPAAAAGEASRQPSGTKGRQNDHTTVIIRRRPARSAAEPQEAPGDNSEVG